MRLDQTRSDHVCGKRGGEKLRSTPGTTAGAYVFAVTGSDVAGVTTTANASVTVE